MGLSGMFFWAGRRVGVSVCEGGRWGRVDGENNSCAREDVGRDRVLFWGDLFTMAKNAY